jgi:hypothetical protein
VLSTLTTTTHTSLLLKGYAKFVESLVKRKIDLGSIGTRVEMDEVRELHDELWTTVDNYGGNGDD